MDKCASLLSLGQAILGEFYRASQKVSAGLSPVSGDQLKKPTPCQLSLLLFSTFLSVPILFLEITSKNQLPVHSPLSQALLSGIKPKIEGPAK